MKCPLKFWHAFKEEARPPERLADHHRSFLRSLETAQGEAIEEITGTWKTNTENAPAEILTAEKVQEALAKMVDAPRVGRLELHAHPDNVKDAFARANLMGLHNGRIPAVKITKNMKPGYGMLIETFDMGIAGAASARYVPIKFNKDQDSGQQISRT